MEYDDYYKCFKTYLYLSCKDYEEVFAEGKKMKKAVEEAIQHAAMDKWYGDEEGADNGDI